MHAESALKVVGIDEGVEVGRTTATVAVGAIGVGKANVGNGDSVEVEVGSGTIEGK